MISVQYIALFAFCSKAVFKSTEASSSMTQLVETNSIVGRPEYFPENLSKKNRTKKRGESTFTTNNAKARLTATTSVEADDGSSNKGLPIRCFRPFLRKAPDNRFVKFYSTRGGGSMERLENPTKVPSHIKTNTSIERPESPNMQKQSFENDSDSQNTLSQVNEKLSASNNKEQSQLVRILPKSPSSTALSSNSTPWIEDFLAKHTSDKLLSIPRDFIADQFNLYNLGPLVELETNPDFKPDDHHPSTLKYYRAALRMILDPEYQPNDEDEALQQAAKLIYLYTHARFVTSQRGLDTIHRMLQSGKAVFGRCSRLICNGMRLLPYGFDDTFGKGGLTKRYCCSCGEMDVLGDLAFVTYT